MNTLPPLLTLPTTVITLPASQHHRSTCCTSVLTLHSTLNGHPTTPTYPTSSPDHPASTKGSQKYVYLLHPFLSVLTIHHTLNGHPTISTSTYPTDHPASITASQAHPHRWVIPLDRKIIGLTSRSLGNFATVFDRDFYTMPLINDKREPASDPPRKTVKGYI